MADLHTLEAERFKELLAVREKKIQGAEGTPPQAELPANLLAGLLHPQRQRMTVTGVREHYPGCKTYTLFSKDCAYFSAGQYVAVYLNVSGIPVSRPYTLSSSPREALRGGYRITVKAVEGGIASNYILQNWRVGIEVEISGPLGGLTYEPLRDAQHIVGVAGGVGVSPFFSLAQAIADGDEDCDLTLLYGVRRPKDFLFRDELDRLAAGCGRLRVEYVCGNITAGMVSSQLRNSSVFVCGPPAMYAYMREELKNLSIPRKSIRFQCQGEAPARREQRTVTVTVICQDRARSFPVSTGDTLLRSMEGHGIRALSSCRSGECGLCHSVLLSGRVTVPDGYDHRRMADIPYGHIHPCCTFPETDVTIQIPGGGLL